MSKRYDISVGTNATETVNLAFLDAETGVIHEIEEMTFRDVADLLRQLYAVIDQRRAPNES